MTSAQDSDLLTGPLPTVVGGAEGSRVSNTTVYRLTKGGEPSALRIGRNYPVRESELEALLVAGVIDTDKVNS